MTLEERAERAAKILAKGVGPSPKKIVLDQLLAAIAEEREACEDAVQALLALHSANDDYAKGLGVAITAIRART